MSGIRAGSTKIDFFRGIRLCTTTVHNRLCTRATRLPRGRVGNSPETCGIRTENPLDRCWGFLLFIVINAFRGFRFCFAPRASVRPCIIIYLRPIIIIPREISKHRLERMTTTVWIFDWKSFTPCKPCELYILRTRIRPVGIFCRVSFIKTFHIPLSYIINHLLRQYQFWLLFVIHCVHCNYRFNDIRHTIIVEYWIFDIISLGRRGSRSHFFL